VSVLSKPSHGHLKEGTYISRIYLPDRNYSGLDQFILRVCGYSLNASECVEVIYRMEVRCEGNNCGG
jgi:hypothetical protein